MYQNEKDPFQTFPPKVRRKRKRAERREKEKEKQKLEGTIFSPNPRNNLNK